jgi:hypothetical protein
VRNIDVRFVPMTAPVGLGELHGSAAHADPDGGVEDVEAAVATDRLRRHPDAGIGPGDVRLDDDRVPASVAIALRLGRRRLVAVDDHDRRALTREEERRGAPVAEGRARGGAPADHDRDLVAQPTRHALL